MRAMKIIVESLSLGSEALLVAMFSVGVVWLLCSTLPTALRPLWVVIVPFTFAYCVYWLPVWLGADASGYDVWAIGGIGAPFLAGFFPSASLVLFLAKRRAK